MKKTTFLTFGILLVGLLLGGGAVYSSLMSTNSSLSNSAGSNQTTPSIATGNKEKTSTPPVGFGIQELPQGFIPNTTILNQELSKDQQVYLLINGGTQRIPTGIKPSVLLQYSCTDCQNIISGLTNLANQFNQGERWIYVAPYTKMNETIAVSGYRQLDTYDTFSRTEIRDSICTKLKVAGKDQPLACIEESFSFSNEPAS